MTEPAPGVTLITNDTSRKTGFGRVSYNLWDNLQAQAPFPVRLVVLDKAERQVRVHEEGEVETTQMVRFPEHRYGFWLRASRHIPQGEINHVTDQTLAYLPLPQRVVTVHDLFYRTEGASPFLRLQSLFLYTGVERSHHLFSNSRWTKEQILAELNVQPDDVTVLPLGVEPDRFRSSLTREQARQVLGLPSDRPVVFNVSTESPRKNLDGLLRAMACLRAGPVPDALLVKAGSATHARDRRASQALVRELGLEDAVRFVGYVDDEALARHYRAADVVAVPSRAEGFGLPVLEAMAAGTPCVASDRTAVPEAAGDAALLVDPDDPEALARALARVLQDDGLARELVERGEQRVEGFSWTHTAQAAIAAYQDLLEAHRSEGSART